MANSLLTDTYYAERIKTILVDRSSRLLMMLMTYIRTTRENYFVLTLKHPDDSTSTTPSWLLAETSNGDTICFGYSVGDEFIDYPHLWSSFKPGLRHEAVTILQDGVMAMERQSVALHHLIHGIPPMPRRQLPPLAEEEVPQ